MFPVNSETGKQGDFFLSIWSQVLTESNTSSVIDEALCTVAF